MYSFQVNLPCVSLEPSIGLVVLWTGFSPHQLRPLNICYPHRRVLHLREITQLDLATLRMALKQRPVLQDPGYDSVREICASLGYKSETKTHRHFKILSTKTANYRKRFVGDSATLTEFPLSNVAPEVQACASGFLDQHSHLFPSSTEAIAFSWPTYPSDKSKYSRLLRTSLLLHADL